MKTERVLARDVNATIARETQLAPALIRQVVAALKARDRIGTGRPISPPTTPRDIARILLALSAGTPGKAVDTSDRVGSLPLLLGDGEPSAEGEIVAIIERAAGWRDGDINFREGSILIAPDAEMVDIRIRHYGAETLIRNYRATPSKAAGAAYFFNIPMAVVARIARDILPIERTTNGKSHD